MLNIIHGPPGNGKGIYAMHLLDSMMRRGYPIATNIELTEANPYYGRVLQLDRDDTAHVFDEDRQVGFWSRVAGGHCYIIDEADNYFDSLDFQRLAASRDARLYFKQHRKRNDELYLICQDLNNLWVRIRRMAQRFISVEWDYRYSNLVRFLGMRWSQFIFAEHTTEQLTKRSLMRVGRLAYGEARKYFSWYRTDQLINEGLYEWGNDSAETLSTETSQPGEFPTSDDDLVGVRQTVGDSGGSDPGGGSGDLTWPSMELPVICPKCLAAKASCRCSGGADGQEGAASVPPG